MGEVLSSEASGEMTDDGGSLEVGIFISHTSKSQEGGKLREADLISRANFSDGLEKQFCIR